MITDADICTLSHNKWITNLLMLGYDFYEITPPLGGLLGQSEKKKKSSNFFRGHRSVVDTIHRYEVPVWG